MGVPIRFMSILVLFSAVSLLFAGGQKDSGTGVAGTGRGTLVYLEGEVFINGIDAEIGDDVANSDIIKTGVDSYCEIIFGERNVFRLEENTIADINWAESRVNVTEGALGAVFTKLDKFVTSDKEFTIHTPSAVAGIRGTVFFLKIEDPENTYLCICNGELNMDRTSSDLSISSNHHKAFRFTSGGDTVKYTSAPMLYHDDPLMDSIASRIDYTIPWGKSPGY